jgi:large subunit ribosomal protein L15
MMLNEVTAQAGGHRRRKRVGRGEASGHGKTCGRGNKGCQSRAGGGTRPLHEGGQMPIFRRLPKRGFSNYEFRTSYQVVNLARLEKVCTPGQTVNLASLRELGLVRGASPLVKILGSGTLSKNLTIEAHAFSASAKEAIAKAGGTIKLIERASPAQKARAKHQTAKPKAAEPPTEGLTPTRG